MHRWEFLESLWDFPAEPLAMAADICNSLWSIGTSQIWWTLRSRNRESAAHIGPNRDISMANDAALRRGIVVILKDCFGLSAGANLGSHAEKLLVSIQAGESEMVLRMQVGKIERQYLRIVTDDTCKEVVERVRKLVSKNSN